MNRVHWSVLLVFLCLVSVWFAHKLSSPEKKASGQKELLLVPDYVATNMNTALYDEQGNASNFMRASRMEHYQELGFTLFSSPTYSFLNEDGESPWLLTATQATLYDNEKLEFETNVELFSVDEDGYLRKISTSFLVVDIENQSIRTDQAIEISGRNFLVQGIGMNGNLRLKKINLLNHVNTTYQYEKS